MELFVTQGVAATTGEDRAGRRRLRTDRVALLPPGLRAVWFQTYDEAEPAFARALAERARLPADGLEPTIQAAMFNAALRAAVEHHAWRTADPATDRATAETELMETLRSALAVAAGGVGQRLWSRTGALAGAVTPSGSCTPPRRPPPPPSGPLPSPP